MESVRSTRLNRLETITRRLVAGEPRLAAAVARVLFPVRLLQALGDQTEGALCDAPWEGERFRALLIAALDGELASLDFEFDPPDPSAGIWFPEDSLLVLPGLGLIALAAARLGFLSGRAAAWRDAVFSFALSVAPAESLLRDEENGATDQELGLLLEPGLGSTGPSSSRLPLLESGDPSERARLHAIGALWHALNLAETSNQTSLASTASSLPPSWMCLPTQRIVVSPDGIGIDGPKGAIAVGMVGGLLQPLDRGPGASLYIPPAGGGWVGVYDKALVARANTARQTLREKIRSAAIELTIPPVGTTAGLAPAPCSIRMPGPGVTTELAEPRELPYTRLLFTPVGLDRRFDNPLVAGPVLRQEGRDRPFPWASDLLTVLPYTPVDGDDPLLDDLMDELGRVALESTGLGEGVLQVQLPFGAILRVAPAEGALARVIVSEGVDPARVVAAIQALGPASPPTWRYRLRLHRFRSGSVALLPGRHEFRSRGSGGACDTDIEAVALDKKGKVLGSRHLTVLVHGEEELLGALVSTPAETTTIALRRGGETLRLIQAPLAIARLRLDGDPTALTVTMVPGEGEEGIGAAACLTIEVGFGSENLEPAQPIWLPWRCFGPPPVALSLPVTELTGSAALRIVPEDGWAAWPREVEGHWPPEVKGRWPGPAAAIRIPWGDRAVLVRLAPTEDGTAFTPLRETDGLVWTLDQAALKADDTGVLRLEGTERGLLSAAVPPTDESGNPPAQIVATRALGVRCCAAARAVRQVLLFRPFEPGRQAPPAPPLDELGARAGLDLRIWGHPLTREDRLAVLPRSPVSPDDPLTLELLLALSSEALRTVGGERWLWLAVVDDPGDWFRLSEAAGAWRTAVTTIGGLPALLERIAALPDPGEPEAVWSLRLSGLLHDGGRLAVCELRQEIRLPGGAEPCATGLVARLKDRAGRTLREIDVRAPIAAQPAPLRALLPLDGATVAVELWAGATCLRTLPVLPEVASVEKLHRVGEALTWTLDPPKADQIAAEVVEVDLLVPAEDGGLRVPLAVGSATAGALDLPLHRAITRGAPSLVIRTRTGACIGRGGTLALPEPLVDRTVILRVDMDTFLFASAGSEAISWHLGGLPGAPPLPDGGMVKVPEGAGWLEGTRGRRVDRRALVPGCPCSDAAPARPLVLTTPWVDDGGDGLRASAATIERELRVLERELGLVFLPTLELAWVEDGLAIVHELPRGPDDALVTTLIDRLWLRSVRSAGAEDALWSVVLPGPGDWFRESASPSARRLLVAPVAGLTAYLRREARQQPEIEPPVASAQLAVIVEAKDALHLRIVEAEQASRPRTPEAASAPAAPGLVQVHPVTDGRTGDAVNLTPRLLGAFFAAMVPVSRATGAADIITPQDTTRISRPSRGPGTVSGLTLREDTLSFVYQHPLNLPPNVHAEARTGRLWTPLRTSAVGASRRISPARLIGGTELRIAANDGWQTVRSASGAGSTLPPGRGPVRATLRPLTGGRVLVDTGREVPPGTTYTVETDDAAKVQATPAFGTSETIRAASVFCPGDRPLAWSGPGASERPLPTLTNWARRVASVRGSVVALRYDGHLEGRKDLPAERFLDVATAGNAYALLRADGVILSLQRNTTEIVSDSAAIALRGRSGEDRLLILRRDGALRVNGPRGLTAPLSCCCKPLRDAALWGDSVLVVTHDGQVRLHALDGGQRLPLPGGEALVARRVWAHRKGGAWIWTEADQLVSLANQEQATPVDVDLGPGLAGSLAGATSVEVAPDTGRVALVDARNTLQLSGAQVAGLPLDWPALQLHWIGADVLTLIGARRDIPDPPEVRSNGLD